MEKITKRSFYEALMAAANDGALSIGDYCDNAFTDAAVADFCSNEIALLDKKASKAKERAAAKRAEGDELTNAVRGVLTDEFTSIADITAKLGMEDVTVHKVAYKLKVLIDNGEVEKQLMTVEGEDKARKVQHYRKIAD